MKTSCRPALRLLCLVACLVGAAPACAGSIAVSPIRIELSSAQRSVALTVRNDGDQSAVVQAQLVAWSQADNGDRLEPTADVIASPPIFTVAPGVTQIVRVGLRRAPDAAREMAYRILLNEVPGAPQEGFTGAQFALKISLPIFVSAAGAAASPQLEWSGTRNAEGALALSLVNSGAKHIQVRGIEVGRTGADPDASFTGLLYVLPGQRRTVTIKPDPGRTIAADRIRVKADTDAGSLDADVVLGQP